MSRTSNRAAVIDKITKLNNSPEFRRNKGHAEFYYRDNMMNNLNKELHKLKNISRRKSLHESMHRLGFEKSKDEITSVLLED